MNLENVPCSLSQEEWGLDPLFWTSAKLFVGDLNLAVSAEPMSSTVFFIGNGHVIRSVELVGIVVSVKDNISKMTTYQIDDGTGTVTCVQFITPEEQEGTQPRNSYSLGDTVCIEGRIAVYKSERQVIIRKSKTIKPEEETLGWLERLSLRQFLASSIN